MKIIKERKLVGSHVSILELCEQVIDLNYSYITTHTRKSFGRHKNLYVQCKTFCKVQISYDASTENYEYPRLLRNKQL